MLYWNSLIYRTLFIKTLKCTLTSNPISILENPISILENLTTKSNNNSNPIPNIIPTYNNKNIIITITTEIYNNQIMNMDMRMSLRVISKVKEHNFIKII